MSVGQITSDLQNSCQAQESKIFRFTILKIRIITSPVSRPQEGRIMIVTTRGARDAVDALASGVFSTPDENAKAYGEVVWSWRRDAGAKLAKVSASDGGNKPAHRGEHEVSRKAIAQGMSECFRCPVCSCAPNVQFLAHETAGAARTRHSLRPLRFEGARHLASPGRGSRRGNAESYPSS